MYILGIQRNKLEWFNNDEMYGNRKWMCLDLLRVLLRVKKNKKGHGGFFFFFFK